MVMNYFEKRKIKSSADDILRHAQHVINMRGDLLSDADRREVDVLSESLRQALKDCLWDGVERIGDQLYKHLAGVTPRKPFARFREEIEVLIVAVAAAMAVKAYFIQPFKIPTGSMQPTLNGVTIYEDAYQPGFMDRMPFKFFKWIVTGQSYKRIVVKEGGVLHGWYDTRMDGEDNRDPVYMYCIIAGRKYKVPERASIAYGNNTFVPTGTVLWSGVVEAGDHVFVDKVSWNFRKPHRGEIIVFTTNNIKGIPRGTHYIKRLLGMPGEAVSVESPYVRIDGRRLEGPWQISRIQERHEGYQGYQNDGAYLPLSNSVFKIPEDAYFAMGDNTLQSLDSRFWGSVPRENMVGPALVVYWPFTSHWGLASKR